MLRSAHFQDRGLNLSLADRGAPRSQLAPELVGLQGKVSVGSTDIPQGPPDQSGGSDNSRSTPSTPTIRGRTFPACNFIRSSLKISVSYLRSFGDEAHEVDAEAFCEAEVTLTSALCALLSFRDQCLASRGLSVSICRACVINTLVPG